MELDQSIQIETRRLRLKVRREAKPSDYLTISYIFFYLRRNFVKFATPRVHYMFKFN